MKLLKPFLEKKKRLAADEWGTDLGTVQDVFQPLEDWLVENVPGIKKRYPPVRTRYTFPPPLLFFFSFVCATRLTPPTTRGLVLSCLSRCGTCRPTSADS